MISAIYTKTGDNGDTALTNGKRVTKDDPCIEFYGTIDELNSHIGLLRAQNLPQEINSILERIQHELYDMPCRINALSNSKITESHVNRLEADLDKLNSNLSPLSNFILPAGNISTACCHIARTICRRAERRLVTLMHEDKINTSILKYLNRLSDLLFIIARYLTYEAGEKEILHKQNVQNVS